MRRVSIPTAAWTTTPPLQDDIVLTWDTPMDVAVLPANGSWTVTANGVPQPVQFQGWDDPLNLRLSFFLGVLANPVLVTLNTEDPNLRTATGLLVDVFGPITATGP